MTELLKEYFKFADSVGELISDKTGMKMLYEEDIKLINAKRDELFGDDWRYE